MRRGHVLVSLALALALVGTARAETSIARAACQGRQPCRVEETRAAGHDTEGRELTVVKLLLSAPSHPHADGSPALDGDCARFEWALVVREGDAIRARPLVEICNDGYGAAGVGEDLVVVSDNRFSHTRVGGSAWRWSETTILALSPLAVVGRESTGSWSVGPNEESRSIDYPDLLAVGSWYVPMCSDELAMPGEGEEARWIAVPRVTLSAGALSALREGASLGTCGALVDGRPPHGIALEGRARPASASLRALWPIDGPLVVEVHDDRVTDRDRLEVWVGPARPSYMDECRSSVSRPRRYAIRASDGRVSAPSGVATPSVERRAIDGGVLFFVTLPRDARTLTLAYADADGGAVVRRIASSTLEADDAASLGEVVALPDATCRPEGRALAPRIETRVRSEGPAIDP